MAKNTIIVYTDLMEQLEELSLEERGTILTAMIKYQMGEELPKMSKLLKLVFIPIRQSIDRDNEAYVRKCEKNRENINKRWNTNVNERIRRDTNHTDNDNDTDIDNENDNDIDNDIDNDNDNDNESGSGGVVIAPTPTTLSELDIERLIKAWNSRKCTKNITRITQPRKDLLAECGDFESLFRTIMNLDFQVYLVQQANNGKPVMFDWFIQPENFQKVAEGNYAQAYGGGNYGLARDW